MAQDEIDGEKTEIEDDLVLDNLSHTPFKRNILTYLTGWVVKKALRFVKCDDCRSALVTAPYSINNDFLLIRLKDNGGLLCPAEGVLKIIFAAEMAISQIDLSKRKKEHVASAVLRSGDIYRFFPDNEHLINNSSLWCDHLLALVKLIVDIFFDLRQHRDANTRNQMSAGSNVRQVLNRMVIFRHN